ncbi:MAG: TolC family protein [Ignavibacteriaceae bacterium]|nr:TolC family protein [Ignavibacteriaceae bacterium]
MKQIVIIFIFLISSVSLFPQRQLSLDEAVKIALKNNIQIQKINNGLVSVESNVKAALGELLPSVNGNVGWNWSRTENKNFPAVDGGRFNAGVNSNWVLYDGLANYSNLRSKYNDYESALLDIKKIKQDIVFQTISSYYDLIYLRKLMKVREDDLAWNKKNLEIITERNKLGSVTLADVYQQQVKVGTAELELLRASNNFENSKSAFLYYLGLDVLENYELSDPTESGDSIVVIEEFNVESLRSMIEAAFNKRPDYLSAKIGLLNAEEQMTINKAGHLPVLSNSISFGTSSNEVGSLFNDRQYSFGLTLSIPIFSGWSVENRIQIAEVNKRNKELELRDLEKVITKEMQKTYLDMVTAQKGLEVSRKNVFASTENRRIEEEKYSLGSTTLLNVLIANSEYTNAVSSYISARVSYLKYKEELDYRIGSINFEKYEN